MLDRYDRTEFVAAGDPGAVELARDLAESLEPKVYDALRPFVSQIVEDLRRRGHAVEASDEPDGSVLIMAPDGSGLRLNIDVVMSWGWHG